MEDLIYPVIAVATVVAILRFHHLRMVVGCCGSFGFGVGVFAAWDTGEPTHVLVIYGVLSVLMFLLGVSGSAFLDDPY